MEENSWMAVWENSNDAVPKDQDELNQLDDSDNWLNRKYEAFYAFERTQEVVHIHNNVHKWVDRSVIDCHQFWNIKKLFYVNC